MDIPTPLRELGAFAVQPLIDAIAALDPREWLRDRRRQRDYAVHRGTESVVLLFTDGAGFPAITVTRGEGWDLLAPSAVPLMHAIIARAYEPGGTIIRAMAARLLPGAVIAPHRDSHPSFAFGHRIHVPITTNPRVRFTVEGRPCRLEVGQAYELDNQRVHSVMNKGSEPRVSFIFDYVPPARVDRGVPA